MTLKEWIDMLQRMRLIHGEDAVLWLTNIGGMPETSLHRTRGNEQSAELIVYPWWKKP